MADQAGPSLDPATPRRVHVVGVGGAGMSAIAGVLATMGHSVSGTDAADSPVLRRLADAGVDVVAGHDPARAAAAEVVVRSTAVPDSDPDVVAARDAGVTVWRRADVLAAICRQRRTIAVSGTHGKTTTSSMLAVALDAIGWHPSMIIGGDIAGIGPGARWDPAGEWFVVEADESDGTFLQLGAEAVVVTSVEADHLEFYGGRAELEAAFGRFVADAPGPAVLCGDDPGAARLAATRPAGAATVAYGTSEGVDLQITDVTLERGRSAFRVTRDGRTGLVELAVPGLHNVRNAAAVIAVADALGAPWEALLAGVGRYRGVARRFESRGTAGGVDFVDGYDHLPPEVAAAVATARAGGWDRVVVIFQPHRYSRTESLWAEFADCFSGADVTVVTGIYPAGEAPRSGVTGRLIADAVTGAHPGADVRYVEDLDAALAEALAVLRPGDICLTLGAGDITRLPDRMIAALAETR